MKNYILVAFVVAAVFPAFSQEGTILKGKIKAEALEGGNIHIINITQKTGTVNTVSGDFQILVKENDTLLFSSIQFEKMEIPVSKEVMENRFLIVELTEDVNVLSEVNVSNIKLTGSLGFDSGEMEVAALPVFLPAVAYNDTYFESDVGDPQSSVENIALRGSQPPVGGVNILGLMSSLAGIVGVKSRGDKNRILPKADAGIVKNIRNLYAEDFFIDNLKIEKEFIDDFIFFADDNGLTQEMAKGNELDLIEFLIEQSKNYNLRMGRS